MSIFEGAATAQAGLDRAAARIARMDETHLLNWLDAALSGMQHHLDMYRKTGETGHLGELGVAEMTVNLVVSDLLSDTRRRNGVPGNAVLPGNSG